MGAAGAEMKKRKPWGERHAQSVQAKAAAVIFQKSAAKAEAEFQSQITTVRMRLLMACDGEDATDLLAMLAAVIGTPCEYGAMVYGRTPWVRQLHGALRTIQTMCLDGYRWQDQYAQAIDSAVELAASQDLGEVTPAMREQFNQAWLAAIEFSTLIHSHRVTKDTVSDAIPPNLGANDENY